MMVLEDMGLSGVACAVLAAPPSADRRHHSQLIFLLCLSSRRLTRADMTTASARRAASTPFLDRIADLVERAPIVSSSAACAVPAAPPSADRRRTHAQLRCCSAYAAPAHSSRQPGDGLEQPPCFNKTRNGNTSHTAVRREFETSRPAGGWNCTGRLESDATGPHDLDGPGSAPLPSYRNVNRQTASEGHMSEPFAPRCDRRGLGGAN